MVPNCITIVFTVTPPCQPPRSQLEHPNQRLSSVRTHRLVLSLTVTAPSGLSRTCVRFFREHSAESWSEPPGIHALTHTLSWALALGQVLSLHLGPLPLRHLNCSCRLLGFKEMVPPARQDQKRGDLQEGSPLCSRRFSHLADIQVLLQVIGVIELQDRPERSPLLALPGEERQASERRGGRAGGG